MNEQVVLYKVIYDSLSQLTDDQIDDIIHKKAVLKIEYPKVKNDQPISLTNLNEICRYLDTVGTRESALSYLTSLSLTKKELKEIAQKYNIPLMSKDTNTLLVDKIIENVVGSKLRFDALLRTNLGS